jgi:homoserine trans-succinylase
LYTKISKAKVDYLSKFFSNVKYQDPALNIAHSSEVSITFSLMLCYLANAGVKIIYAVPRDRRSVCYPRKENELAKTEVDKTTFLDFCHRHRL